jgi:hypothetical protein
MILSYNGSGAKTKQQRKEEFDSIFVHHYLIKLMIPVRFGADPL